MEDKVANNEKILLIPIPESFYIYISHVAESKNVPFNNFVSSMVQYIIDMVYSEETFELQRDQFLCDLDEWLYYGIYKYDDEAVLMDSVSNESDELFMSTAEDIYNILRVNGLPNKIDTVYGFIKLIYTKGEIC